MSVLTSAAELKADKRMVFGGLNEIHVRVPSVQRSAYSLPVVTIQSCSYGTG